LITIGSPVLFTQTGLFYVRNFGSFTRKSDLIESARNSRIFATFYTP
jgi:hypothetical protein